jgi:hypothetical protein
MRGPHQQRDPCKDPVHDIPPIETGKTGEGLDERMNATGFFR